MIMIRYTIRRRRHTRVLLPKSGFYNKRVNFRNDVAMKKVLYRTCKIITCTLALLAGVMGIQRRADSRTPNALKWDDVTEKSSL